MVFDIDYVKRHHTQDKTMEHNERRHINTIAHLDR